MPGYTYTVGASCGSASGGKEILFKARRGSAWGVAESCSVRFAVAAPIGAPGRFCSERFTAPQ